MQGEVRSARNDAASQSGLELRACLETMHCGQALAGRRADPAGAADSGNIDQTARRLRPLARRALITARPPRVFMRTRKPWVRARRVLEGW